MKNPWVIIGIIAVFLIGLAVWYSASVSATYDEGVTTNIQVKGNPDAAVVLVEYSDFQCPACAQFQPIVAEIVEKYGDDLRFEYRHFPLMRIHPYAEAAARAAEAAGQQGKFFEYHDLLFVNQTTWVNSPNPGQYFIQYAKDLGLDMDQFVRQQKSGVIRDHVRAQYAEAGSYGFTGTPSFLLNGEKMTFGTFEEFEAQIAAAIDPSVQFGSDETQAPVEGATTTEDTSGIQVVPGEPTVRFGL